MRALRRELVCQFFGSANVVNAVASKLYQIRRQSNEPEISSNVTELEVFSSISLGVFSRRPMVPEFLT